MNKLSLSQAKETASAYFGLSIELVVDRSKLNDRCTVWSLVYDGIVPLRMKELCHGRSWVDAIAKVLPEISWKEFNGPPKAWSEYLEQLRAVRKAKENCQRNNAGIVADSL